MAGTLIYQYLSSTAAVHTNYFDPLINQNTNFMALDIRKPGIYSGGYLTVVNSTTLTLSNLSCEIQDGEGSGNQVRMVTSGTIPSIPVSNTSPPTLVVLRWNYSASTSGNYPYIYTVLQGSQNPTDLILGTATYSGSTLSVDYGVTYPSYMRSDPNNILDLCLKIEPITNFSYPMTSGVVLRYGRVSYGNSSFQIPTQVVPVTASIGTTGYYQVVLLQVSTSGVVSTTLSPYGVASVSSSPTPPAYNSLITLAEITVQYTGGTYYITSIKDVRPFVNFSGTLNGLLPSQTGNANDFLQTNGTTTSWHPAVTSVTGSGYVSSSGGITPNITVSIPTPTSLGTSWSSYTSYQNNTGRTIEVQWIGYSNVSGGWATNINQYGQTSPNNSSWTTKAQIYMSNQAGGDFLGSSASFYVPNGYWWQIIIGSTGYGTSSGISSIEAWQL